MTCLGFFIISWASFFSRFSRDGERLSRLVLGDGNDMSTSSEGRGVSFFFDRGGFYSVFPKIWVFH